jgi:hypothetical protein
MLSSTPVIAIRCNCLSERRIPTFPNSGVVAGRDQQDTVMNTGCATGALDLSVSRIKLGITDILMGGLVEECEILRDKALCLRAEKKQRVSCYLGTVWLLHCIKVEGLEVDIDPPRKPSQCLSYGKSIIIRYRQQWKESSALQKQG